MLPSKKKISYYIRAIALSGSFGVVFVLLVTYILGATTGYRIYLSLNNFGEWWAEMVLFGFLLFGLVLEMIKLYWED